MNELDIYYRALRKLAKDSAANDRNRRFKAAVGRAETGADRLLSERMVCHIEQDWVEFIELHLPYVERAIKEERQFIRREGETVDIGKAKKVSRDSVEHLARHSEMITHLPEEDEMLIPDKIFITENQSNYLVYENRFLYLLLTFMNDFVESRYSKISELGNSYKAELQTRKKVNMGKRTVEFSMSFKEQAKSDPYADADNGANDMLSRVEAIRVMINAFMMTPLMKEVSKAPLISPPITRTNVLRMDNNFKYCVELYDYLVAYSGQGYRIERRDLEQEPFEDALEKEIEELTAMLSYLVYKHGSDASDLLEQRYLQVELAEKERAQAEKREALEMLKQRAGESPEAMQDYMLALQEQNDLLEQNVGTLRAANDLLQHSLVREAQKLAVDYYAQADERFAAKQEQLQQVHAGELAEKDALLATAEQRHLEDEQEKVGLWARIHALEYAQGIAPEEDTTTREYNARLEQEYLWFNEMFDENWKKTKRRIRKEILWSAKKSDKSEN